jgi:DNA-binding response OmpR family regulator
MSRMLIAEPEQDVASHLRAWFADDYCVDILPDANSAKQQLRERKYDVVFLSTSLPDTGGMSVCRFYRACGGTAVVVMLSDKHSADEMEAGIDQGADDFESKPLNIRELSARVKALCRRQMVSTGKLLSVDGIVLDARAGIVLKEGVEIHLQHKEFKLLELLLRYPNQIFSCEALLERVWQRRVPDDTVRTHIKTLRKKIDAPNLPSLITTVRGQGYKVATSR